MKKLWSLALCLLLVIPMTTAKSYGEILNGFTNGDIHVMMASLNGVECKINLKLSMSVGNTGQMVRAEVKQGKVTNRFTGRSTSHNRTSFYTLDQVSNPVIYVDEESYEGQVAKFPLSQSKTYSVKGRMTFRWKASPGKVAAGFPRYYYRTVYTETKTVVASDIDGVLPELPEEPEEEVRTIDGEVGHTDIWEERRKAYNRDLNYYWPGEKILVSAQVESSEQPTKVEAFIEGTPYVTTLMYKGSVWQGKLLDSSMLENWAGKEELELGVTFKAYFRDGTCEDLETIVVDDSQQYWLLHRKE